MCEYSYSSPSFACPDDGRFTCDYCGGTQQQLVNNMENLFQKAAATNANMPFKTEVSATTVSRFSFLSITINIILEMAWELQELGHYLQSAKYVLVLGRQQKDLIKDWSDPQICLSKCLARYFDQLTWTEANPSPVMPLALVSTPKSYFLVVLMTGETITLILQSVSGLLLNKFVYVQCCSSRKNRGSGGVYCHSAGGSVWNRK